MIIHIRFQNIAQFTNILNRLNRKRLQFFIKTLYTINNDSFWYILLLRNNPMNAKV